MSKSRHLPWHVFQENYIDPGVPASLPIFGEPMMHVIFQPQIGQLGLIADVPNKGPIQIDRRNIFSDLFELDGSAKPRIYVRDEPLFREFYAICTEVSERCQLDSEPYESALSETISAFDLLLKSANSLAASSEIGLVGELLILESMLHIRGDMAVDGWRGAARDKHDFRIDDQEIEVKSTTGNQRNHWIHGLTQLTASKNCQLDLVSIHLARTAGKGTLNLKDLVARISAKLINTSRSAQRKFRDELGMVATQDQVETADGQFHFRDSVLGFPVDEGFPQLSRDSLEAALGSSINHVVDINYLLNLDSLAPTTCSALVNDIIEDIRTRYD